MEVVWRKLTAWLLFRSFTELSGRAETQRKLVGESCAGARKEAVLPSVATSNSGSSSSWSGAEMPWQRNLVVVPRDRLHRAPCFKLLHQATTLRRSAVERTVVCSLEQVGDFKTPTTNRPSRPNLTRRTRNRTLPLTFSELVIRISYYLRYLHEYNPICLKIIFLQLKSEIRF